MRQLVKHCKALVVLVVRCLADLSGPSTWSGQMGEMGQTDEAEGTRSGKVFASVAVERLLRVATAIIALVASGAVPLPAAIACVLGANIGTTGTI